MTKLSKSVEAALAKALRSSRPKPWQAVMAAVGFEVSPGQHTLRPIGPASELTPEQRALAVRLLDRPGAPLRRFPIYAATWLRRQWLGLAPAGAAFEMVKGPKGKVARIELLRDRAREGDHDGVWTLIDALALAKRVELLATIALAPLDFYVVGLERAMDQTALETIKPRRVADRSVVDFALGLYDERFRLGERPQGDEPPSALAKMLFGTAIDQGRVEQRYESLFRLGTMTWTGRALKAITPERRGEALARALDHVAFPTDRPRVGARFLMRHPHPELARATMRWVRELRNPGPALERLRGVVKKHPDLASILPAVKDSPEVSSLRVVHRLSPVTLDALRPRLRLQLEKANELYGGHSERAEEILERPAEPVVDERIHPRFLEYRRIAGPNGPLYDAWLYMGDSGVVFRLGTTRPVAEIIQGSLSCHDDELLAALRPVLRPDTAARKRKKAAAKRRRKKAVRKK